MTTPIFMLVLMTGPYLLIRVLSTIKHRDFDLRNAAAIGLAALFLFTGCGHFIKTTAMADMLPPWIPAQTLLVYLSGLWELALAAGFMVPRHRRIVGWIAATTLVCFLPVNIYAAITTIPMGGHAWGPMYLLVRVPLQGIILLWVYWFTIRRLNQSHSPPR